jgi:hypothetical protein
MSLTAEQLADVMRLTGLSSDELNDLISCSKVQQATIIQGYRSMSWTKDKDILKQVIAALNILVTVAGGAGTVASGVLGVVSLLKLL